MNKKKRLVRFVPVALGGAVTLGIATATIAIIKNLLDDDAPAPKKTVYQITLVQPPPPPPPPKIDEPPPEPDIEEPQQTPDPVEQPSDAVDELPAGDLLGLDADGGIGADGFGLIARKGGRSLIGGGGGGEFDWYTGMVQREIQDALSDQEQLRADTYVVDVKLWIAPNGKMKRFQLLTSTGNKALDELLKATFNSLKKFNEEPPVDMPQPVRLRIASRK